MINNVISTDNTIRKVLSIDKVSPNLIGLNLKTLNNQSNNNSIYENHFRFFGYITFLCGFICLYRNKQNTNIPTRIFTNKFKEKNENISFAPIRIAIMIKNISTFFILSIILHCFLP
jgi:hypothetical protein